MRHARRDKLLLGDVIAPHTAMYVGSLGVRILPSSLIHAGKSEPRNWCNASLLGDVIMLRTQKKKSPAGGQWRLSNPSKACCAKVPEAGVANNQETNNTSDPWTTTTEAFLQSRHVNIQLEEQLRCLLTEEDNIRAKNRDLQRNLMAMRAELRRIKKVEKRTVFLEAEIQAGRKKLEEEQASTSLKEQYLQNLCAALTESQKIIQQEYLGLNCHVNKLRRQIQECKLSCAEKDEVLTKMEHESQKVEECIKEYEETIQVLEDRQQAWKDKLSGFAEKKLQQIQFSNSNLNINPWSLMNEIVNAELGEEILAICVVAYWRPPSRSAGFSANFPPPPQFCHLR
ncbi:transmembrane and coiled-coil domain-containing protein 5B-like [Heteronotia binoei]|uniref:transmembrane and coiled-coil domain-containing protein 5B-like n=1 Tax=Heteronotia binoei TaxID=13085 RepID=UPI00292F15B8|nr:transmembrane and coiled-coil domain-containing protein 5B-like [Heteronotia binoei]